MSAETVQAVGIVQVASHGISLEKVMRKLIRPETNASRCCENICKAIRLSTLQKFFKSSFKIPSSTLIPSYRIILGTLVAIEFRQVRR